MNALSPAFLKQLADQAAEIEDHNAVQTSYDFEQPPAGPTVGRFVEYIELGEHPRKAFAGKAKKNARLAKLVFELNSPQHIFTNDDGTTRASRITINVFYSESDKSNFRKLYNALKYGRDGIGHIAQMLGDPYLFTVVHNTSKDSSGKEKTYANLREGAEQSPWLIGAPVQIDAIAGTRTPYNVPPAISPLKTFIWDLANKETWDSLFIDGTREIKNADGTTTMQSKNYLQELILAAKNFDGSPIQQVLSGLGALPTTEVKTPDPAALALAAQQTTAKPAAQPVQAATLPTLPTAVAVSEAPSPELVALLVQGVPIEEARKQLAAKAAPAPAPVVALVDPRVAALKAAGLTDEQIALALGGQVVQAAPANPTPAAPVAAKKGGRKKTVDATATPASPAPALVAPVAAPTTEAAPANVMDALKALNLTAA